MVPLCQLDELTGRRDDHFYPEVTFEHVLAIYGFDQSLRASCWAALTAVELAVRVDIGYVLGKTDPFLHERKDLLDSSVRNDRFHEFTSRVSDTRDRSKEDFVEHFRTKYAGRMPVWVLTEILQFGQMVTLYEMAPFTLRREIADRVDARADELRSWLKAMNIVRNISAHHGRLWNRSIGMKPMLGHRTNDPLLGHAVDSTDRVYGVLCVIAYLLRKYGRMDLVAELKSTLESFPHDVPGLSLAMMRVPKGWAAGRLWRI